MPTKNCKEELERFALPWRIDADGDVRDSKGDAVAMEPAKNWMANSRFILRACNHHHRLLAALRDAAGVFRAYESLHRAKPDHGKADFNKALAVKLEAAIEAAEREEV